ncbi:AraC-like DNA-binding protein [Methylobacterium brachiatum]|uniref:AraC-like DNA-binding protein n=1 Tax=Methylobacterium brachiatum TaxID=269660 RepID=A0AAJ1U248_9HYPH|nr:AraC family transcriptional regulator [Methylobacterium brachiatum]MCB4805521.1 AraC family transcriptional regulator [Methylobacterium brachiatum]MDQ0546573.1 AraC-like DNA-binding protein [Methylobacterium brachiatum]
MVLSEGAHRLFIDGQALDVQGGDEGGDGTVVLLNTTRASRLHHDPGEAAPVRSVTIAAPHAWLDGLRRATTETDPVLQDFLSTHRAQLTVPASRQIRHLADQIYDPPPTLGGAMRALHCKARALDILCQACAAVREHTGERSHPHLASRRRSERVRDYVLANLGANLTIERIAAEIGASVSSVQRHFKEHFRMTVFEFIRSERLAQACAALERDGVTIAQAAYVAGYADPSNFTVAFKRAYGVLPKHKRR